MEKNLVLVDYENVPRVDLSGLDDSYSAIVFVGAAQNPPRAAKNKETAHRFKRVQFQKISGSGRNALDFHIAFELGRSFESSRQTICTVVSKDKGFDPLLKYLNSNGLACRRIESFSELAVARPAAPISSEAVARPEDFVCPWCKKAKTIEHHGGRWCSNCGCFASPPDPKLLPSNQGRYRESIRSPLKLSTNVQDCAWCHQQSDMGDGIYDDGEWMCGGCIAQYAR